MARKPTMPGKGMGMPMKGKGMMDDMPMRGGPMMPGKPKKAKAGPWNARVGRQSRSYKGP